MKTTNKQLLNHVVDILRAGKKKDYNNLAKAVLAATKFMEKQKNASTKHRNPGA